MYLKFGELISDYLGTDQNHYVEQQPDGVYHKKAGIISPELISKELLNEGSIAIYQKNVDLTIKWICFDFDILKANLVSNLRSQAEKELENTVITFCESLNYLKIPFLIEFSGNRGFHVWITLRESINYHTGYDIQQAILTKANLEFNEKLIAIDLFPHSATPTGGVGVGVKIPLSKHKKSGFYSYLLADIESIKKIEKFESLSKDLLMQNISILDKHTSITCSELEIILGEFFENYKVDLIQYNRIKSIKVQKNGFSVKELLTQWNGTKPLSKLAKKIESKTNLSHAERKLIVGLLCNVWCTDVQSFSNNILHEIFSSLDNYDEKITDRAISSLRSFNFPTRDQIESTLKGKFSQDFDINELLKVSIPKYVSYIDANFEFSDKDIEITRVAELNYLFMNDEVQSKVIIEELSSKDNSEFHFYMDQFISGKKNWSFYKHSRNEENKKRELITLNANSRIATSCILKQISYYLDLAMDENSHGYQINKGFSAGYIFKPWLYLWLKFISNITTSLEDQTYRDYYIVKTDIKSFYNNIPHDNLKRLLLGDGDSIISSKILTMGDGPKEKYIQCLDAIFNLTENVVDSKVGLPQGPAYARYFAELYLSGVDTDFKNKIRRGEVLTYQRYVDDIFFITKTKQEAESILEGLKNKLGLLNLKINIEKTKISKISSFHEDFNKYRAQSKYSVDQVSRKFATSSDKQKNMAISEFVSLIQSDSCQDDLSFIFSHLGGVKELNPLKTEQVLPALNRGVGRGSLFKNLFNYVLELNEGWEVIYEVSKYNDLQSEVLTSCLINSFEINKAKREQLIKIVEVISPALSKTELVSEHLAYLIIAYGCNIDVKIIKQKYYMSALASISNNRHVEVNSELLDYLNTSINELKSITVFIKVMYAFCYNDNIKKSDLNTLASLFYSKVNVEEEKGTFSEIASGDGIFDLITANKFYYLLCVFSVSNRNSVPAIVSSMWKYCARTFNKLEPKKPNIYSPNWLEKIKLIDINHAMANWIISSIVDGNIFRGEIDEKKVFERFHNALLVHLSLSGNDWENTDITENLEKLKSKSIFYNWLIDNDGVSIFPDNTKWFEMNIIENGITTLKKGNEILLRKPTDLFFCDTELLESSNGFSELVVQHDSKFLETFRKHIEGLALNKKLGVLLDLLSNDVDSNFKFFSYYCPGRVFDKNQKTIFSSEFCYHSKIIYDDELANITSFDNTKDNFIKCFLFYISVDDKNAKNILEKYFNNLEPTIDKHTFISKFSEQMITGSEADIPFYNDIAVSAALYLSYGKYEPFKRLEIFTKQHSMFYEQGDDSQKHIFAVKKGMVINDITPVALFLTILTSVELITGNAVKSLPFYLADDIKKYEEVLSKLIISSSLGSCGVELTDFNLSDVNASIISRTVIINRESFSFDKVNIINPLTKTFTLFDLTHVNLIAGSDHVFTYVLDDVAYIFSANTFISKMYSIIKNRYELIINQKRRDFSYVVSGASREEITALTGFDNAQIVIQHHRSLDAKSSKDLLINWLSHLPIKFHQTLITLIQGHEYMSANELTEFVEKVKTLDADDEKLFLIKKVEDYNGTHRILYRDSEVGRGIATFNPFFLKKDCKEAVLVADLILTVTQVIKAFQYYFKGQGNQSQNNYYECIESERNTMLSIFKGIDVLKLCTVLYTEEARIKIQDELRIILGNSIKVEAIHGRNIGGNAFFGKTTKISENEKIKIINLLMDFNNLSTLYDYLSYNGSLKRFKTDSDIQNMDLVTRFQSLPKKSFDFLRLGLKADNNCKPFNRIQELPDK